MAFNLGPLHEAEGRFRADFSEFSRLWTTVAQQWQDEPSQRFEREHLASLGPSLSRLCSALQEFSDQVRRADSLLAEEFPPSDRQARHS